MKKLPVEFYDRNSIEVSKDLLGKFLAHRIEGEEVIGKIVEVEAYMGPMDKAAHSYKNRRTERTEIMFGPPGFSYVFSIYGMYYCMNIVVEKEGSPQAVLIRALEPVKGMERMAKSRFHKPLEQLNKRELLGLTNGPGKLCRALEITKQHNGLNLLGKELYLLEADKQEHFEIVTTKRINIDYAEEAIEYPWRFYIKDNPYISKK